MRKVTVFVLVSLLFADASFAGPLKDAIARAAQTTRPVKSSTENKMLWPGIGLMVGGATLALYGFNHVTGATVGTNATFTSASVTETHAKGVGFTGLAIAGAGGALIVIGQKQSKPDRKVTFGLNQVTIRF